MFGAAHRYLLWSTREVPPWQRPLQFTPRKLLGLVLGPVITAIVSSLFEAYTGPAEIIASRPLDESRDAERLLP